MARQRKHPAKNLDGVFRVAKENKHIVRVSVIHQLSYHRCILRPRWVDNGYEIVGPYEEVYLSDPGKTMPEELLTEVRFPVKKRSGTPFS